MASVTSGNSASTPYDRVPHLSPYEISLLHGRSVTALGDQVDKKSTFRLPFTAS